VLRAGVRYGHFGALAALHAHVETVRTARAVAATCVHTDNAITQATATAPGSRLRTGLSKSQVTADAQDTTSSRTARTPHRIRALTFRSSLVRPIPGATDGAQRIGVHHTARGKLLAPRLWC
jgi:hypothetical protein